MFNLKILSVIIFLVSSATSAFAQSPVMVGGEADIDACGGFGVVAGLDLQGDNFLAVRSGPGTKNKMIDKIFTDREVILCDRKGNWLGIIYFDNPDIDCGVSSPIAKRGPYRGSCKSGWVYKKYVSLIAG